MNRLPLLRNVLLIVLLALSNNLYATHGMGGELTWKCQGNSYVFEMKFYRDCNGIPGPSSVTLTTNVPGVPSIPMPQVSLTDISPTGSTGSGISNCPVCPPNPNSGGGPGAVHEYLYRSAPVVLPGIPPATGWVFSWGDCCRSNALTNMANAGSLSMGIRAVMYPYVGFVAGQCRDNSPFFAEKPNVIICTGYQFTYNHNAIDLELDSLVYSWDSPVSEPPIAPLPYAAGYSVSSPLPGPMQNPGNVPATLDPRNGEITFTSFTQGYFVTVVKVTAYKCNTKAAEIFREINVVLIGGCIIPGSGSFNMPPAVTILNRKTGLPLVQNKDTISVGDTLRLRVIATDADPHPVEGVQSVTFTVTGAQLAQPPHSPSGTCLIIPCAYTSAPLPLTAIFGTQMDFDWPITCPHLGFDTLCTRIWNTYNFVIKVRDNYCPAPGQTTNTLSITVKPPPKLPPPQIRCVSVQNVNGDVSISWARPAPRDTFGVFKQYKIFGSLNAAGPYTELDSLLLPTYNFNTGSYTIPGTKLVSLLGNHAQNQSVYFRMKTVSACFDSVSEFSNIARSIKLDVSPGTGNAANLNWNPVHNPLLATSNPTYYIYREFPFGTWTLVDSVLHPVTSYTDTFPASLCEDTLVYRILTLDSLPCNSWSSFDTLFVNDSTLNVQIIPRDTAICPDHTLVLSANVSGLNYQWTGPSFSANTQSVTVSDPGTYYLTVTTPNNGCTASDSVKIEHCEPSAAEITWTQTVLNPCSGPVFFTININCLDAGTCDADSIGGPPYTYEIRDTTNNIIYGPYTWNNPLPIITPNIPLLSQVTVFELLSLQTTDGDSCGVVIWPAPITIALSPSSSATLSGSTSICQGDSALIQVTFAGPGPYSFTYNSPSGLVGPIVSGSATYSFYVSPSSSFNYTLQSVAGPFCPGTVSGNANITVNAVPQAALSGTTTICNGQSANITVNFSNAPGPYNIVYNPGNVLVNNVTNPYVFTVSPSATTNYTLVSVSNASCTGGVSGSALVTVEPLPTASISGNPVICAGQSANLTVNFGGAPGPYNITYNPGNVTVNNVTNPYVFTVTPGSTTTYNLVSVSTSNCQGSVSGSATVTVNSLPAAVLSGTDSICFGELTNLDFTFTGTAPFSYSYTDGSSTFGPFTTTNTSVSIAVSPAATTTYTLLSVGDANCNGTVSGSATITVIPLPTAVISGSSTICNGQSTSLSVAFTGSSPFEYMYSDGVNTYGPFVTSANPVTISVSPSVTTTYTLTSQVTGAGCAGTTSGSATVTVHQLPDASITGNTTICNGDQTSFTINFNGVPPFTYSYSDGSTTYGPFVTAVSPVTVSVSPSVSSTYTLISISDNNCNGTTSGSASVTVHPLPSAVLTGTTAICDGDSTTLTINFTGTAPFTYSYSDGSGVYGPFTTSGNPEIINVQPAVSTSYTLLNLNDANCNGNVTGQATITVNELPTAVISGIKVICSGQIASFTITFTGTAPFTYVYTNGTQNFGPFTTSSNPETVSVSPSTSQNYSLVSVSDANCPGSVSGNAVVTVHPLPQPVITGNNSICDGEQTTFDAGSFVSYLWSNGSTTQTITISQAGTYTVTVTDSNGCQNTDDHILIVNQTPAASFTNDTSLTCTEPVVNFINTSVYPPGSVFNWTFGTVGTSTQVNPSQSFPQSGTYTVTLIITTPAGCADTITHDIEVIFYPLPVAEFKSEPKEAGIFNSLIRFTDLSQNAVSWWWDFGDGQTAYIQHPGHIYDEMGKFTVTLTVANIAGCTASYKEDVYITPFFVPNAFTPNEDGLNERFFESGYVLNVASYSMSIFNRWGQKVFENDNHHNPWRGTDKNGNPAPEGVYVYAIKVKTLTGKDYYYSGTVTLLR